MLFSRSHALRRRLRAPLAEALAGDEPLLRIARSFLAGRRDLFTAAEVRRLQAVGELSLFEDALLEDDQTASEPTDGSTASKETTDGEATLRRRRLVVPAELVRRPRRLAAGLRPVWRAAARSLGARAATRLEHDASSWLARRVAVLDTARALARLPQTSVRVASPVLLSRCDARDLVYTASPPLRGARDPELAFAAWLAQAFEAGWVIEGPESATWRQSRGNTVQVTGGPVVRLDAATSGHLERYVAAVLLERRDVACDALCRLLNPPLSASAESVERRLRDAIRQLVPDRDRLDGDWSDRPESNLLGHWRLLTLAGLRPGVGLRAFYRGLAAWDRRGGDLRRAHQRWLAARAADALCSDDLRYARLSALGERAARWLDRPILD
ncbi:MAG: hypothetical protein AAGC60_13765 [Acidobacteriota bacterium]